MTTRASKIRPGAVLRIQVPGEGDGVALITHQHDSFGDLVRVYAERLEPHDAFFDRVLMEEPVFSTFTVVRMGLEDVTFEIAGFVGVPTRLQTFPTFRCAGLPHPITNDATLWLWDGVQEWRVEQEPDLLRLPTRVICSPGALVEALQAGWTDERSGAGFVDRLSPRM